MMLEHHKSRYFFKEKEFTIFYERIKFFFVEREELKFEDKNGKPFPVEVASCVSSVTTGGIFAKVQEYCWNL